MIRILFDDQGNGHKDLFLKIDASPSHLEVVDTYYLGDFFNFKTLDKPQTVIEFIHYILKEIDSLSSSWKFIPIDISDQYVGGLNMRIGIKSLVEIQWIYTDEILGFNSNVDSINEQIADSKLIKEKTEKWLINKESIFDGLLWSIERIKTNTLTP